MDESSNATVYECMHCRRTMKKYDWGLLCSNNQCQSMRIYSLAWWDTEEVVDAKRYRTSTATLLACTEVDSNESGYPLVAHVDPRTARRREIFATGSRAGIFRTPKGRYFLQMEVYKGNPKLYLDDNRSLWPEECSIQPLSETQALDFYWKQSEKLVPIREAFPDIELEDA